MKRTAVYPQPHHDTDGTRVVGQAGGMLLTRTALVSGLAGGLSRALAGWRKPLAIHDPGKIVCDLAISLALGGDCLADASLLRAEPAVYGRVASDPTISRLIATLAHDAAAALAAINTARAEARERVWRRAGEHAPDQGVSVQNPLVIDVDATLVTAHSDKEQAKPTFKKGYGFHPLCAFADHGPTGTGEPLALLLRPGNAGSNKAADHITVLRQAFQQLPDLPDRRPGKTVLVRVDGAGYSHDLVTWLTNQRVQYSVGWTLPGDAGELSEQIPATVWQPAYNADGEVPAELTVVMEPTRNAWIPVAAWFKRRGVKVVLVPTTQSADLRSYYSKHTKNDRLDSAILARLPLLHPEGLREHVGDGPADPLRRIVKQRSSIAKRRTAIFNRLDAQLELLGPAWYDALGTDYGKTTLQFLARYADPNAVIRLGQARLARFLHRYSHGQWHEGKATELLTAAHQTLKLWDGDGMDFTELAADIAIEAEQAQVLTAQMADLDERIANLYAEADPTGIIRSAPGVGPVIAGIIAGRLGDPHRFTSLAAVRSYSGLVRKVNQSGQSDKPGGLTKAGDPLLREALWMAAEQARKLDPQLAAKYKRLMDAERHHDSAVCHIATTLLSRIASCWRQGQPYQIRDVDGTPLTQDDGKRIVKEHHQVAKKPPKKKYYRATNHKAGREPQESLSAPTSRPATTKPRTSRAA